ncbi:class A beta-lactamase [Mesorhizobium sp. BR1-1-16]|uniref:class A beta-lactamase n=1 Tax=Mesorhizobium sp. BR1-1-16 TaxID=2876653 RepID=UPI001CCA65A3|nr:class A beta-lactamase [Mesorhizobium sp. BR1-1-16]MBZ9935905.1 class A beta-lactamase [Mesorhizobium sp. BR1-1-16]
MVPRLTRRTCLATLGSAAALPWLATGGSAAPAKADLRPQLAAVEASLAGRLGVAILDGVISRQWLYKANERFPLCSTFKVLAAAAILQRVDADTDSLSRRVIIKPGDLVEHSPVTEQHIDSKGMTLADICAAALTTSDNTAGNMMLKAIGGPAGLTSFVRSIGDGSTRLDRWETALNEASPGDDRDTTTPLAMARSLQAVLLGSVLSDTSKKQLGDWMLANQTGDAKLRAGLPKRWRIGDKTGGGNHGTTNDVAIIFPPGRTPLIAAVYITETSASFEARNAAIATVGRALAAAVIT